MTVGQIITKEREALGLTRAELARRIGRSRSCLTRWEDDDGEPGRVSLIKLANAFGMRVGWNGAGFTLERVGRRRRTKAA